MSSFKRFLDSSLTQQKHIGLYRERILIPEDVIDFSSNDYLGLKDNPSTKQKLCQFIEKLSLGSGASALISGYTQIQRELEDFLAKFKETESCIVVGSGYMANIGLLQAITEPEDIIFSDQLNHASIIDGIRLSKAKKIIYNHLDLNQLEEGLRKNKTSGKKIIVTDSVFSMDGDIAPLKELTYLSEKYDAVLIIDEAHATGVLGKEGKGTLNYFNIKPSENIVQIGTLSKAVGSYGAFICGTKLLIDFLVNKMRSVIFTTALSPVQNFISLENLKILKEDSIRRKKLFENIELFLFLSKKAGIQVRFYGTPILTVLTYDPFKTVLMRDKLLEKGFYVGAVRPPTVPEGLSRLRITITSKHTDEQIQNFVITLKEVLFG